MRAESNKSFWGRVLEALLDMGIDQDQQTAVAKLIKIKQPSVFEWTEGSLPSMKNAVKLANELGVNVEWLYTGRGSKRPISIGSEAEELWELWRRVPAIRGELLKYARFLVSDAGPFAKDHENAA